MGGSKSPTSLPECVHGGELYPCVVPAFQVDFLEAGAAQSSVIAGVHPWGLTFS